MIAGILVSPTPASPQCCSIIKLCHQTFSSSQDGQEPWWSQTRRLCRWKSLTLDTSGTVLPMVLCRSASIPPTCAKLCTTAASQLAVRSMSAATLMTSQDVFVRMKLYGNSSPSDRRPSSVDFLRAYWQGADCDVITMIGGQLETCTCSGKTVNGLGSMHSSLMQTTLT